MHWQAPDWLAAAGGRGTLLGTLLCHTIKITDHKGDNAANNTSNHSELCVLPVGQGRQWLRFCREQVCQGKKGQMSLQQVLMSLIAAEKQPL